MRSLNPVVYRIARQPIGLTPDRELVFRMRRLLAVRDILGWDRIEARNVNVSSIAASEYTENEIRKDLTLSKRDVTRPTLEEQVGRRQGKRTDLELPGSCPEVKGREARDVTSAQAGFTGTHEARAVSQVTDLRLPDVAFNQLSITKMQ